MRKIAAIFILAAVAVVAQNHPPENVVPPSSTSDTGPRWDKGAVEGRTYKNLSVGIELAPPPGLEFVGAPELKGNPGTVPLVITLTAAEAPTLLPGRRVMSYYSDALAYYPPGQRSTSAYLRKVVQGNKNAGLGFRPVGDSSDQIFGGVAFARQDFENGAASEAVLVKACDAQALVFIFAASNRDGANKLIAATELKLDPERSGCVSNAAAENRPSNSSPSTTGGFSGEVFRVSPDVKPPRVVFSPEPSYPQEARKGHAAGEIVIGMVVGSDGQPRDVKVISGIGPELDSAAVDAAEKWRFQPGVKDGKPVPVKIAVEFDFRP
jgi:TonB family protein